MPGKNRTNNSNLQVTFRAFIKPIALIVKTISERDQNFHCLFRIVFNMVRSGMYATEIMLPLLVSSF